MASDARAKDTPREYPFEEEEEEGRKEKGERYVLYEPRNGRTHHILLYTHRQVSRRANERAVVRICNQLEKGEE